MQEAHRQLDLIARLRREGRHDEANALLRQQHDDAQTIDESPAQRHALLCTVEAAKGHEFDAVMVPGLEDGSFPLAGWDRTEESNRFYVAVTRMRDELILFVPEATASVSPFVTAMHVDKAIARGRSQLDALLTGHDPAGP